MKAKSKLKDGTFAYGSVEMTDQEYMDAQNPMIRTTIFLEEDLIRTLKQEAIQRGIKYQQLVREKLKGATENKSENLVDRVVRLEAVVFKKPSGGGRSQR